MTSITAAHYDRFRAYQNKVSRIEGAYSRINRRLEEEVERRLKGSAKDDERKIKVMADERLERLRMLDEWASESLESLNDSDDWKQFKEWQEIAEWKTPPKTITDTTELFNHDRLCLRCRSIPLIASVRSEDATISDPSNCPDLVDCPLCEIIGPPHVDQIVVPQVGSWHYFQLLNWWLRTCHKKHNHAMPKIKSRPFRRFQQNQRGVAGGTGHMPIVPLKLLDVHTMEVWANNREDTIYVALSHRWSPTGRDRIDLPDNTNNRVLFSRLPAKFRDAVMVTRRLGERYLWIDGICINQDPAGAEERIMECDRMELIFSNALCVLAVTSNPDQKDGFLSQKRVDGTPFRLNCGREVPSLQVVRKTDDFSRDVLAAEWNSRGWTFQERALSRHTIYFTQDHTYWECGSYGSSESGVSRVSNLSNDKTSTYFEDISFDSDFPKLASSFLRAGDILQRVYTEYTLRGLSESRDRPIAIMGVEYRLATHYQLASLFGILDDLGGGPSIFFESLVWKRSNDVLRRIAFHPTDPVVPSWSWMSLDGSIDYLKLPGGFTGEKPGFRYEALSDDDEEVVDNSMTKKRKHCQLLASVRKIPCVSLRPNDDDAPWPHIVHEDTSVGRAILDKYITWSENGPNKNHDLQAVVIGAGCNFLAENKIEENESEDNKQSGSQEQYLTLLVEETSYSRERESQNVGAGRECYYCRVGLAIVDKAWLDSNADISNQNIRII